MKRRAGVSERIGWWIGLVTAAVIIFSFHARGWQAFVIGAVCSLVGLSIGELYDRTSGRAPR